MIADAVGFQSKVRRCEFGYVAFDVIYHSVYILVPICKIMIKSCKRKIVFAKFASYLHVV